MPIAIVFIRGINVGGKNKLPMATLRGLCEALGWRDVVTHIQSGNVVFRCTDRALAGAARKLEAAIERECGFRPGVVVRTLVELRGVVAANPFAGGQHDPSKVLVMFLGAKPGEEAAKAMASLRPDPERLVLIGTEAYLWYPNGVGASKFQFTAVERALKVTGTCRNWNTVLKVIAMAESAELGAE